MTNRRQAVEELRAEGPGAEEKPLQGERVAFTGRLANMDRRQAWMLVRSTGGEPVGTVSGRTTLLVVGSRGWSLLTDGSISRKLARAELLREEGVPLKIESEIDFFERIGLQPKTFSREPPVCTIAQAARMLGMAEAAIRLCCQFGLIRSRRESLNFPDLVSLRSLLFLFQEGISPAAVARGLERLSALLPQLTRPLAQVRLIVDGRGDLLAQLQGARMELGGQLLLDFSAASDTRPATATRLIQPLLVGDKASELFETALFLEEEGKAAEAGDVYRQALKLAPLFAEAHFNLGNLLLAAGDPLGAEEHYRSAVGSDPELACAWYNLGYALADQNRVEEAAGAFRKALSLVPTSGDAHFNLALCCEDLDLRQEAARHWLAYLRLQPRGEWAEIARRHLSP